MRIVDGFVHSGELEIDLQRSFAEQLVAKTFEVFDFACDQLDVAAAQSLLATAKGIMARNGLPVRTDQDLTAQLVVDAHFRLWELRYLVRENGN